MVAGLLVCASLVLPNEATADEAPSTPAMSPSEQAQSTGQRVEILERRAGDTQWWANPDGTFTYEQSMNPRWVRKSGVWVDVDPTVEVGADGLLRTRATSIGMTFSAGGSSPLVSLLSANGDKMSLRWPTQLPAPSVDGGRITYPEVFPGTDLVLTAGVDSFSQVLVVKTRAAASQPALDRIELAIEAPGLTVQRTAGGGLQALDRLGARVFGSPAPTMWDSRGGGDAEDAAAIDRRVAPVEGDEVSTMPLEVSQTELAVSPDQALIDDPATVYPLHVDPALGDVKQSGHAMIDKAYPSSAYWNWTGDQGAGYQNFDGWSLKRLLYSFWIPGSAGKHILSATFSAFQTWSSSCTATEVQLWETAKFTSSATWSNSSSSSTWLAHIASQSTSAGRDSCENEGQLVNFGVTSLIQRRANAGASYVYMGLRAADETNPYAWKRFKSNETLSITYNSIPNTPTAGQLETHGLPCVTSTTGYPVIGTNSVELRATLTDADAAYGETLKGVFELWVPSGDLIWRDTSAELRSGRQFTMTPSITLQSEHVYWWRVRVTDGTDWSSWSPACFFEVDLTAPPIPTITLDTSNAVACPDPAEWRPCYRAGSQLKFTLGPNGANDVTRYGWSINVAAPTVSNVPAGSPTVTVTLTTYGPIRLYAWSYDSANHVSNPTYRSIMVINPSRTGRWLADEGSGTTLADNSGLNHPMSLGSTVTWTAGDKYADNPADRAIVLWKGVSSSASTTTPDIIDANGNFSVAARVRVGTNSQQAVVLSEDGSGFSSFTLGVLEQDVTNPDDRKIRWGFSVVNPTDSSYQLTIGSPWLGYAPDQWVHLVGACPESCGTWVTIHGGV